MLNKSVPRCRVLLGRLRVLRTVQTKNANTTNYVCESWLKSNWYFIQKVGPGAYPKIGLQPQLKELHSGTFTKHSHRFHPYILYIFLHKRHFVWLPYWVLRRNNWLNIGEMTQRYWRHHTVLYIILHLVRYRYLSLSTPLPSYLSPTGGGGKGQPRRPLPKEYVQLYI